MSSMIAIDARSVARFKRDELFGLPVNAKGFHPMAHPFRFYEPVLTLATLTL